MTLPHSMLEALRGRLTGNPNPDQRAKEIAEMTPAEIIRECAGWYLGDPSWATQIADWMRAANCTVEDLANVEVSG